MSDDLVKALNRIAAAIERLTPPGAPPVPEPCVRCGGCGYLGNPNVACHVCAGTGLQQAQQRS